MAQLDELLRHLKQHKGSDLHLAAGLEPRIRVHGELRGGRGPGAARRRRRCASCCARSRRRAQWQQLRGAARPRLRLRRSRASARFRANYFVQEHGAGAVFRMIPEKIVPLEELKLPPAIERLAHLRQGPRAGDRADRLGQVDHARGDHRPDQPHLLASTSSRSRTRSSSCTRTRSSVLSHREVGSHTQRLRARRCAPRSARTPTSCWSARCATTRRSRSRSPPPRWACSCSARCTPTARAKTIDRIIDTFPADEQAQVRLVARRVARRRGRAAPAARPPTARAASRRTRSC